MQNFLKDSLFVEDSKQHGRKAIGRLQYFIQGLWIIAAEMHSSPVSLDKRIQNSGVGYMVK